MRTLAGPHAEVHFTHLSQSSCDTLTSLFKQPSGPEYIAPAFAHTQSVLDFMKENEIPLKEVCLLDPKAESVLAPEDGDGRFSCFLFGVSHSFLSPIFMKNPLNSSIK